MTSHLVRRASALAVMAATYGLSGCTTLVNVRPATDPASTGYEYYLPQPILLVRQEGTSTTVSVHRVPDYNRAYRIDHQVYLAADTFTVQTDHGLLTQVSTDANAVAVAKAGLDTGAAVLTAYLAAKAAEEAAKKEAHTAIPSEATYGETDGGIQARIAAILVRSGKRCLSLHPLDRTCRDCPGTSPAIGAPPPLGASVLPPPPCPPAAVPAPCPVE